MAEQQAKQTPLVELLDAVPADVCIGVQDGEDWSAGTTWHPVGRMCHEAAAELRRLHAVNRELLEALKEVYDWCYPTDSAWAIKARAAIAKAEGA
jgi:hypothetical protein